jgi:superfamily II DNA/RNA helicase
VAIASTGSGKTAGFLLPAFLHIQQQQQLAAAAAGGGSSAQEQQQQQQQQPRGSGRFASKWNKASAWGAAEPPRALVLAPTRELAQQIQQEAERLVGSMRIRTM